MPKEKAITVYYCIRHNTYAHTRAGVIAHETMALGKCDVKKRINRSR